MTARKRIDDCLRNSLLGLREERQRQRDGLATTLERLEKEQARIRSLKDQIAALDAELSEIQARLV